jgi:hypothetical protein
MVKLTVSRQVWQGLKNIKDLKQAMIYLFCYFILNDVLGVGAEQIGTWNQLIFRPQETPSVSSKMKPSNSPRLSIQSSIS